MTVAAPKGAAVASEVAVGARRVASGERPVAMRPVVAVGVLVEAAVLLALAELPEVAAPVVRVLRRATEAWAAARERPAKRVRAAKRERPAAREPRVRQGLRAAE